MRPEFIDAQIFRFQELQNQPPRILKFVFTILGKVSRISKFQKYSKFIRFFEVSYIPFQNLHPDNRACPELEVLFVAARKDFGILTYALQAAKNATQHHKKVTFYIVVPDLELQECKSLVKSLPIEIEVLAESSILEQSLISKIQARFEERAGWVLQQVLKNEFVLKSASAGVLVIDADTLLIEPRNWLDSDGIQLLTPTWEFHRPYYDFLSQLKISNVSPKFTFVSHHLVMQPKVLNEIFFSLGWEDINQLIEYIIKTPKNSEISLFSIDFELYAQYLFNNHPEKISIQKWSNFSASRKILTGAESLYELTSHFQNRYASLSLHSYSD
jgi:hypothetical protein